MSGFQDLKVLDGCQRFALDVFRATEYFSPEGVDQLAHRLRDACGKLSCCISDDAAGRSTWLAHMSDPAYLAVFLSTTSEVEDLLKQAHQSGRLPDASHIKLRTDLARLQTMIASRLQTVPFTDDDDRSVNGK